MAAAVKKALPADAAVMVAAVSDWRTKDFAPEKIKKRGSAPPALLLKENPDILATTAGSRQRPKLLIGFAAETEDVLENAARKRKSKGVDWIVANDVSPAKGNGSDGRRRQHRPPDLRRQDRGLGADEQAGRRAQAGREDRRDAQQRVEVERDD
jgi:phosphopantothenoylcysteine synthetase/decarboxylase